MPEPVNEASASAGSKAADANAFGAFVVHGSGPQTPSVSAFFNVLASRQSTATQFPASASATVSTPVSRPAAPQAPTSNNQPAPPSNTTTAPASNIGNLHFLQCQLLLLIRQVDYISFT
ncbi:hypothetical protein COLO4_24701 [Corchorus olitorius]|uniref:Uncharacterized protein n=1 Tax=Corchorus olitorius TaxID=93759 RepID=A0A1R3I7M9_9ROSI|nr:hypothetical protein COLO4_24701 [Corchorus olitorius]